MTRYRGVEMGTSTHNGEKLVSDQQSPGEVPETLRTAPWLVVVRAELRQRKGKMTSRRAVR